MEFILTLFVIVVVGGMLIFLFAPVYKNKQAVRQWFTTPDSPPIDYKTQLERRIEDAEVERRKHELRLSRRIEDNEKELAAVRERETGGKEVKEKHGALTSDQ